MNIVVDTDRGFLAERLCATMRQAGGSVFRLGCGGEHADVAILLRWGTVPSTSINRPDYELSRNLSPLLHSVDELIRRGVMSWIFVSSGGAIFPPSFDAVSESALPRPGSFYGAGKIAAEAFLSVAASRCGARLTILRPSNVYGPGQKYRAGFGIVPAIYHAIRSGSPLELWPSSRLRKDYIFVDDFVKAVMCVAQDTRCQSAGVSIFNVASDSVVSVPELVSLLECACHKQCSVVESAGYVNDGEGEQLALDSKKFRDAFMWQPNTTLPLGLEMTVRWLDDVWS